MRLEWLDDILAVAQTGSFHQAAEQRHLTQSAFSRRVQAIEDYIGVPLFDRTRKPVQLRPTTAAQAENIARLAQSLRQLAEDLRLGDRLAENRIVITSQHALTTALTPKLLQRLQATGPEVFLKLRSANLDDCFALLLSGQADIGLVYKLPGQDHPIAADYIETETIGTDRLIPVIGQRRFAAGRGTPALYRLSARGFLWSGDGTGDLAAGAGGRAAIRNRPDTGGDGIGAGGVGGGLGSRVTGCGATGWGDVARPV